MGRRVIQNASMRLERTLLGLFGTSNAQAAVCPAIQSDRKNMPENTVDECPDGNDLRPSSMVCL